MPKMEGSGYWVCDSCGHVRRGILDLELRRNSGWVVQSGDRVILQESEDLPDEHWLVEPTSVFDRGRKLNIRGVAAISDNDALVFVLDPEVVQRIEELYPGTIEWLPQPEDAKEDISLV